MACSVSTPHGGALNTDLHLSVAYTGFQVQILPPNGVQKCQKLPSSQFVTAQFYTLLPKRSEDAQS